MENTIDFKKNSPQNGDDDKHSAQNPKISTPAASEGKGKGPVAAADDDDKKEAPPADATHVPAAERAEKGNAGGGQKAGRKRARGGAAAGEGSVGRDNQGGGGAAGGYQLPVEEPMKLTTCPWEGCSSVFDNKRALYLHVSVHVRRPWLKPASSSTTPVPSQERKAEKEVEGGGKAAPPDGDKPATTVAGGAATDEARKAKQLAEIDLNLKQFLVPDLNLYPPEYFEQQEAEDKEGIIHG